MTVEELIKLLNEMPQDAVVMLATQPGYPIAETLRGVEVQDSGPVWLVSGGQPDDPYDIPAIVRDAINDALPDGVRSPC